MSTPKRLLQNDGFVDEVLRADVLGDVFQRVGKILEFAAGQQRIAVRGEFELGRVVFHGFVIQELRHAVKAGFVERLKDVERGEKKRA